MNTVDVPEFLDLLLQAVPQRALWSKLFEQSFCFVKSGRVKVTVLDKQSSEAALYFGFRKQCTTLGENHGERPSIFALTTGQSNEDEMPVRIPAPQQQRTCTTAQQMCFDFSSF